jgi:DNA-binding transcriptional regulator YiaG
MKYYVYRHNYYGFYDWVGDLNKIRNDINSYQNMNNEMKEYYAEKYSQALQCYKDYLKFKSTLCNEEVEFIELLRKHKTPAQNVDFASIYKRWEEIVIASGHASVIEITPEEVGTAIKEAREFRCFTRKRVAEIIDISVNTLKMYEYGKRTLPFDIYYKLKQFLDLKI